MDNLFIKGSSYTPEVDFNAETGELKISGESYHNYTIEFFEPIFDWLKRYTNEGGKNITLNFHMSYFNTSSSRRFLEIINLLEDYQFNQNGQVTINWGDEDGEESVNWLDFE